jgi:hypothetical protein
MRPKCPTCGGSLPAVAVFCPRCGSATPIESPGERELYRRGNVRVTSRRLVLGDCTVSLSSIANVRIERRENYRKGSATRLSAGVLLVIGGLVIAASGGGIHALWLAGSIGMWLILLGILRAIAYRRWHLLVVRTAAGTETLKFDGAAPAEEVSDAISAAIAERNARNPQT